ncbi:hypothetical protein chmu123 [Choristoneura murinana nucleopolyhedrovirus]|uniref:Uncharacterized protein n=1 Tax=Choristoneura murinana nucleopolyhedrovirus TaxID=1987479 RepID=V9XST4_9ABAC|nr:hypothetical protein chmu123 [Choristoneura murinana nucleopolyhedrovirus]AHD25609.1 hypothetical protein chmu123 [Choristoneura murinana nucleopolyhedrovirus]
MALAFRERSCSKSKVGADACFKMALAFRERSCSKSKVGADSPLDSPQKKWNPLFENNRARNARSAPTHVYR